MLEARDLHFSYGRGRGTLVLAGVDWQVAPGATTLLLGPNGAGKSTLLKLLSGFERPQRGSVSVAGDASRDTLHREVAWMPQDVQPARGLTVAEQVEYVAWLAGLDRATARRRAGDAIEAVDLVAKRDVRTDRISGGQLRRVGLAQALVRRAPVLLLDEPTAGLDPAQTLNFRSILRDVEAPGGVVVSTHQVNDLEQDVDRVTVLAEGELRFDGPVEEFRGLGGGADDLVTVFADMVGGGSH
ncbi:ABC transporter ATP-binding protein [Nocardioides jishulii]|uniref:ABC transporter ATP-binding protein n=1 Tax=Nocardioides jishulii TaxID=2575440 RepID=A0A4U2YR40_9ACTN|nr:ABC transporter ATP-binding protein [Nocardioides jishulii]QCX26326.1 ABC transporter ATP-binding protein [Nocardioides jishulii]TKI63869.1 ABC transporter ATP-binding protein [Nocardioides jishulii]